MEKQIERKIRFFEQDHHGVHTEIEAIPLTYKFELEIRSRGYVPIQEDEKPVVRITTSEYPEACMRLSAMAIYRGKRKAQTEKPYRFSFKSIPIAYNGTVSPYLKGRPGEIDS